MLGFEIMHPQQSLISKTKSSVIGSQSCTSNQVKLFFEPCISFFVHIWSLCLQSMWHQIGISTCRGSAHYIIKLCWKGQNNEGNVENNEKGEKTRTDDGHLKTSFTNTEPKNDKNDNHYFSPLEWGLDKNHQP